VARLEHVKPSNIKFLLLLDNPRLSSISSGSGEGRLKSTNSLEYNSLTQTMNDMIFLSGIQTKMEGMKMKIVEKAARLKTKIINF
jgi:hypothetical protein